MFRFATADRMRESCLDCHNNHKDSPKSGWQIGDVRGVLEVSVPLDHVTAQGQAGLRRTAGLLIGLGAAGIVILALVVGRMQRVRKELIDEVARQTAELRQMWELEREISAAGRVQKRLLPRETPRIPGLEIAGTYRPAAKVAGDYYDYISFPDGSHGIVVADVAGHGLAASLVMAGTRHLLHWLIEKHGRQDGNGGEGNNGKDVDLGRILTIANNAVEHDSEPGRFVTMLLARLDTAHRRLTYASGGHPGYLFQPDGSLETLDATGIPLGLLYEQQVSTSEPVELRAGQILVLFTDGMPEARSPDGNWFGLDRVWEIVRSHRERPAEEIVAALRSAVEEHCAPDTPQDDITIVVVKVDGV